MIGIRENKMIRVPLMDAVEQVCVAWSPLGLLIPILRQTREVARAMKSKNFDKALELRGPEFLEMLQGFSAVSSLKEEKDKLPADKVSISSEEDLEVLAYE
jgi:6-phosphofructokinase 1